WGARFVLLHRRQDHFHHAVDVLQHIIVPETQDAIALCAKISGSLFISGNVVGIIMLRSIDLDDESPFVAGEVSEEGVEWGLSPEMRVLDGWASQMPPELSFRVGHVAAESARARYASVEVFWSLTSSHARSPPTPSPPHHSQELAGGGEPAPPCARCIKNQAA